MNPEEELACLLMNYIERNNKLLHAKTVLKQKFIMHLETDSKIKEQLITSDRAVAEAEQENELLWLDTVEIVKEIEEDERELEKLMEENKQLSKKLKKLQITCNCIDFNMANDDLNILSKKMLKLANLRKITKLYIDNSSATKTYRGFSVNLEGNELDCFDIPKDSNSNANLWEKMSNTSEYMNEWKDLFKL